MTKTEYRDSRSAWSLAPSEGRIVNYGHGTLRSFHTVIVRAGVDDFGSQYFIV